MGRGIDHSLKNYLFYQYLLTSKPLELGFLRGKVNVGLTSPVHFQVSPHGFRPRDQLRLAP